MQGTLYVITNKVNGMQYIGKTYQTIEERFKDHVRDSKRGRNKNRKLYRAMNEFGVENFSITSIGMFDEQELELKEMEYIHIYDTYKNGYNQTLGGDGKRYITITDDEFIGLYEQLGTIKAVARKTGHDKGTIKKILHAYGINTNSKRTMKLSSKKIRVNELDLFFNSVVECAEFLINNKHTKTNSVNSVRVCIGRVLTGERKSYNNFTFSYV